MRSKRNFHVDHYYEARRWASAMFPNNHIACAIDSLETENVLSFGNHDKAVMRTETEWLEKVCDAVENGDTETNKDLLYQGLQ